MAERNSERDGAVLVAVLFAFMFMVLYAVACFIAIALTIVYACALRKPLHLFGWTITTKEARVFIGCGVAGLIALPLFVSFGSALFHYRIPDEWWGYVLLGGYSFGAIAGGMALAEAEEKQAAAKFLALPPAAPPPLPARQESQPFKPPFRFGSWNDEDAR